MNEGSQNDDTPERERELVAGLGAWARASLAKKDDQRAPSTGAVDGGGARTLGSVVADRYILKARLGRGRFGDVYRAVDRALSDPQIAQEHSVALQLLHRQLSQQTRLLQKLESSYQQPHLWAHPNVLRVHGFGCDRGQYFLVTELLDGLSLRAVLDQVPSMPSSERETLAVLRGVGDALKYAHAKGAIHGDIRPEKVFITSDYAIKVLDLLPASPSRTLPFFLEDALPSGLAPPDERDDVYGLACLAYELFAGRHPFNTSSPLEAANAGLTLARIPQIGERRWNAIARALALNRQQRTASVAAFLGELGITGEETLRPADDAAAVAAPTAPAPRAPVAPPPAPASAAARARDDDVPIIGDYSGPAAPARQPPAPPVATRPPVSRNEWHVERDDLERYPPLVPRESRRGLGFAVFLLLIAAGVGVAYWNSATLRSRSGEWITTARTAAESALNRVDGLRRPAREAAAVTPPTVVTPAESPAAGERSPPAPAAAERSGEGSSQPPRESRADAAFVAASAVVSGPPAAPESFDFAAPVLFVAESRGVAAVEIRRRGGELGVSSAVWWTSDGSATAPGDYVSFGATIQKFAAGETSRTILIPIVGDSKREGRESFFVNLRGRELPVGRHEPPQRIEIVITDDD